MNIAMLISRFSPVVGGTEIQCYRLSKALAARGHSVRVFTENPSGRWPADETLDGFQVRRLRTRGPQPFASLSFAVQAFGETAQQGPIDILHAHMIAAPAFAALAAGRRLRKPVVVKAAGARGTGDVGTALRTLRGRFKLRLFRRLGPEVICPSNEVRDELVAIGLDAAHCTVIPNGVETGQFKPAPVDKTALRQQLGLPSESRIAVYAGRWAPGKGVEQLLATWETLPATNPAWRLLLLLAEAPTPVQQPLIDRVSGKVTIVSQVREVLPYYQASDLALLTSKGEGLSNFLLEAMACGLPLGVTPAAAPTPAGAPAKWGFILPENEPRALADMLARLQPEELRAMGAAGRRLVEHEYAMSEIARRYEALYERLQPGERA
jgi:glycosyltransferase involved in cell wall biosynthesis